jgi:N-acetylglucosaminyl-diphospho-decaprenol L-rhamnosyltransferase
LTQLQKSHGPRDVTVSIVSHGQNAMANLLLGDIAIQCADRVTVIVTLNKDDPVELETPTLCYPVHVIRNAKPKGFGTNHNAAFSISDTAFFCIANPDIRLNLDPFPPLLETASRPRTGAVGPLVRSPQGNVEDSARRYPTPISLLCKVFRRNYGPDYPVTQAPIGVDWIAGMFMLFRRDAYGGVRGFDESFFLYYEDVDICRRLRRANMEIFYDPRSEVYHHAQRASRRNFRMALHHVASVVRFLSRG